MERGVKTIVCKWRGCFFDARRGSSRHKETPFCNREGRFLNFKTQLPLFLLTILSHPTSSVHSPLHSERGRGWGCFLNSKTQLPLFPLTILSHPTSSVHSPLHSERGWGRGCRGGGGEAVVGRGWGCFLNSKNKLRNPRMRIPKRWKVAGAGLEHATSRLWAWRATNCSNPRY